MADTAPQECPPEALAIPREEDFVLIRSNNFSTTLQSNVMSLVFSRYGRHNPHRGRASMLRSAMERRDEDALNRLLRESTEDPSAKAVVVFRIDRLQAAQETGPDTFRTGSLVGDAFLLDAELNQVCMMTINSNNSRVIDGGGFRGLDMFGGRALTNLFERLQEGIDEAWPRDGSHSTP